MEFALLQTSHPWLNLEEKQKVFFSSQTPLPLIIFHHPPYPLALPLGINEAMGEWVTSSVILRATHCRSCEWTAPVCAPARTFVYMYLEAGGERGEYKNSVLMWLICQVFAFQTFEPYVTSSVREVGGEETCNYTTIVHGDTHSLDGVRCSTVHVLATQFQEQETWPSQVPLIENRLSKSAAPSGMRWRFSQLCMASEIRDK